MNTIRTSLALRIACVWVMLPALSSVAAGQEAWISVSAGERYRILDDRVKQTLQIIIALKDVAPEDVSLTKVVVRRDDVLLPRELSDGFEVAQKLIEVGAMQLAEIVVQPGRVTKPGTYELWISAQTVNPAGTRPQILKVSIEHPGVTLAVLEPIRINIIKGQPPIEATPLKLDLKGEVAHLSNVVLTPVIFPDSDKAVSGKVLLARPLPSLDNNAPVERDLTVSGDFPLGALEGTAEVRGDQLKEPVDVKVSVRTRRSLRWLYVVAALGLLAGFLLKTVLANYLENSRARADGQRMLAEIERQLALHPDESLALAVQQLKSDLHHKIKSGKKEEIAAAATNAKEKLTGALKELRDSQQRKKTDINAWLQGVTPKRELPNSIDAVVGAASTGLKDAADLVNTSVGNADKKLTETTGQLMDGLQKEADSWKRLILDRLRLLKDANALIFPLDVSTTVSAEAGAMAKEVETNVKPNITDVESTNALLDEIERLRRQARINLIESTQRSLETVVTAMLNRMAEPLEAHPGLRADVESALAGATSKIAEGTVEQGLSPLAPAASLEVKALDDKLRSVFATLRARTNDQQAEIDELVKARNYTAAAVKLADALSAPAPAHAVPEGAEEVDTLLSGEESIGGRVTMALRTLQLKTTRVLVPTARAVELPQLAPESQIADVRVSLARTLAQISTAEFVQSLAVGVLFALIAHATYADKFVGTTNELIAIFFWAFGLDLTVAKLLEAGKGVK